MNLVIILILVLVVVYLLKYYKYIDYFENLEYGKPIQKQISATVPLTQVYGPTNDSGANVSDKIYNETTWTTDPHVDTETKKISDDELRLRYKNLYSLSPEDDIAKFDLTQNRISTSCCPIQFAPPHKLSADANCLEKDKYVANPYSGANMFEGAGCVCMTQEQANFLGTRGGNSA